MKLPDFSKITLGGVFRTSVFLLVLGAVLIWTATALSIHLSGAALIAGWGAVGIAGIISLALRLRSRRASWAALLIAAALSAGWFHTIKPQQDKTWAFDVAHGVKARVDGDVVYLDNVRNFDWHTAKTADASWEARSYDLQELSSVDMVTSVWDNPNIAHLIVTFGFTDGQRVAFSVEIRREDHEAFSVVGGFFRQFELVLIAATEEDVIKLRTNVRKEDVHLYPIDLNADQRRNLFLSYVELANQLEEHPKFYNTVTRNCTTTVYPLANSIKPDMGLDWRLLMSTHLPSYIDQLGGFQDEMTPEARTERAAITALAQTASGSNYSDVIRSAYAAR